MTRAQQWVNLFCLLGSEYKSAIIPGTSGAYPAAVAIKMMI